MAQLVLVVVVAAFAGLIGYSEACRVELRFSEGPWGLSASVCGVACFAAALVGGYLAMPLMFAAEAGIVGHHEAASYQRLYRNDLFKKPPWVWGIGSGAFAFAGVLLTSTITWGLVSVIAALVCSLLLVSAERDRLMADHEAIAVEKNALLAEKKSLIAERAQLAGMAKPSTQTHSTTVAAALRAEQRDAPLRGPTAPARSSVVSLWQSNRQSAKVRVDGGSDLLPRRSPSRTLRNRAVESSDLIPKRRS